MSVNLWFVIDKVEVKEFENSIPKKKTSYTFRTLYLNNVKEPQSPRMFPLSPKLSNRNNMTPLVTPKPTKDKFRETLPELLPK